MQLPRDKHDVAAVARLAGSSATDLKPHLPELLEWLQDMNWPVATPVADLLAPCGLELIEPIRDAFHFDDAIWKYWIIRWLERENLQPVARALVDDLTRLRNRPTPNEIAEEVDQEAGNLLDRIGCR